MLLKLYNGFILKYTSQLTEAFNNETIHIVRTQDFLG